MRKPIIRQSLEVFRGAELNEFEVNVYSNILLGLWK
jgi:hypothetical protein